MPELDLDRWERTNNILAEVMEETERQNDQWGEQNHPLHDPTDPTGVYLLGRSYRALEEAAKLRFARGLRAWSVIELEEIFEALAERDPAKARAEWVQVAAVAVQVIACIDRAAGLGPEGPPLEFGDTMDLRGTVRPVDTVTLPDGLMHPGDATGQRDETVRVDHIHTFDRLHGLCRCGEAAERSES